MLLLAWTLLYILGIYLFSNIALNCCVSRFRLFLIISLWQNCFFLPFSWKDLISYLNLVFFPLLNIKSVRVLNSFLFGFQWTSRLSPALNRFCGFNNHQASLIALKASKALLLLNSHTQSLLSGFLSLANFPSENLVGSSGLEPPTSRLSGARSNQLSYEPILLGTVCLRFPSPSSAVSQIS